MNNETVIMIKGMAVAMCAGISAFFGILTVPILFLVMANFIDYVSGLAASRIEGIRLSSSTGFRGICKKVSMYVLVLIGWMTGTIITYGGMTLNLDLGDQTAVFIAFVICTWLLLNELISIIENLDRIGVSAPFLKPLLILVKDKVEDNMPKAESEVNPNE